MKFYSKTEKYKWIIHVKLSHLHVCAFSYVQRYTEQKIYHQCEEPVCSDWCSWRISIKEWDGLGNRAPPLSFGHQYKYNFIIHFNDSGTATPSCRCEAARGELSLDTLHQTWLCGPALNSYWTTQTCIEWEHSPWTLSREFLWFQGSPCIALSGNTWKSSSPWDQVNS